jgi:hypothetical protein
MLEQLELKIYQLPSRRFGEPSMLTITATGAISFKGKDIFNHIDLSNVEAFHVAFNEKNPKDSSTYLIPTDDGNAVPFKDDMIRIKLFLEAKEIDFPSSAKYEIIDLNGKQIIKLHTTRAGVTSTGLAVITSPKRKYTKRTPQPPSSNRKNSQGNNNRNNNNRNSNNRKNGK